MPESETHKEAKNAACGCGKDVRVELALQTRQRLDCVSPAKLSCGEVELTRSRIPYALSKLETAQREINCRNPVLVVKPRDYDYAKGVAPKQVKVIPTSNIPLGSCERPHTTSAKNQHEN
jgi:hypothetical protein